MGKQVFSVCGMCTSRCPMLVHLKEEGGVARVHWVQGNPHSPLKGALCARGSASVALLHDEQRPQEPLIRVGDRGEGKWRAVSWDEAFDYIAEKLQSITAKYGPESLLFSDRGGPFADLSQAFVRGLGSPNYCNHDSACARNTQHACRSVTGRGRKEFVLDYASSKHIVLQTRNIFEGLNVAEVNKVLDGLANGAKLTVIDIRGTVTASKADTFFMINPATDYAFNLAVLNVLITERLYNAEFVDTWLKDFDALADFIKPYTPSWAEVQTGIVAAELIRFVHELAQAAPAVIWHQGWMTARYRDSFYVSRSIYLINALLGVFGAKGGFLFPRTPKDLGRKGLKKFVDLYPKPSQKRADGVGWRETHLDAGPGIVHYAFDAIEHDDPYPVRAYFCHRHDPLMSFPDSEALKQKLAKLELFVSSTFSWSPTAWHADVVLPMSTFLERDSILGTKSGLKPQFFMRRKAVPPLYNTKADWEIFSGLAKRLGLNALVFDTIEDMWAYQLDGTGVTVEDFASKGFVDLADTSIPLPRSLSTENFHFPTPSGKLEVLCHKWTAMGLPSLKPYDSPRALPPSDFTPDPTSASPVPQDIFRLTFGRCALHSQGHTVNNALLHQMMPENCLWIHSLKASALNIATGDTVVVFAETDPHKTQPLGHIKAFVTDAIHPDAVFMIHGFGQKIPVEQRAYGQGLADNDLMLGGLNHTDRAGGGIAMQEHFVRIGKAE